MYLDTKYKIDNITCIYIMLTGMIPTRKYIMFLDKIGELHKIVENILTSNKICSKMSMKYLDNSKYCSNSSFNDNYLNVMLESSRKQINVYQTIRDFSILSKNSEMYKRMMMWKNLPMINYNQYNNNDCNEMICKNFPSDVYLAYTKLIPGAFKSDLWRLCVLYMNGGLYIDSHIKPISIDICSLLKVPDYVFCIDYPCSSSYIYNAFIMAPKRSPLIKELINEIVINVRNEYYPKRDLEISGPGLHGRIIKEFLNIREFEEGFKIIDNRTYLFMSHNIVKNTVYNSKNTNKNKYDIRFNNEVICNCRYENYRKELNEICKIPHYSALFKEHKVYDTNLIL